MRRNSSLPNFPVQLQTRDILVESCGKCVLFQAVEVTGSKPERDLPGACGLVLRAPLVLAFVAFYSIAEDRGVAGLKNFSSWWTSFRTRRPMVSSNSSQRLSLPSSWTSSFVSSETTFVQQVFFFFFFLGLTTR